jgi:hypothetical protein
VFRHQIGHGHRPPAQQAIAIGRAEGAELPCRLQQAPESRGAGASIERRMRQSAPPRRASRARPRGRPAIGIGG